MQKQEEEAREMTETVGDPQGAIDKETLGKEGERESSGRAGSCIGA